MITWVVLYLAIGAVNYLVFLTEGSAAITHAKHRKEGLAEAAFFVFCWPIQLLYAVLLVFNMVTTWALRYFE